jgi:geranylgeranyl diphosphate synthase, type I
MIADTLGFFESRRALIAKALAALVPASGPMRESMERIVEFCGRGKMIRGCLVFLGAAAGGAPAEVAFQERRSAAAGGGAESAGIPLAAARGDLASIAAAMELFQAGLLAHDDIMDRDELRRGAPTIHARYAAEARARAADPQASDAWSIDAGAGPLRACDDIGPDEARHVGESLAICLGDLCYFQAFGALSRALAGNARYGEIIGLCSAGLGEVAVAQMTDVSWGAGSAEVPEEAILAMYCGKTAHYSFSMPLAVGALAAVGTGGRGTDAADVVDPLYELGERLGMLFQIRDDELGLFGVPASIGKAPGSDLREGKKTLFRSRLLAAAPASEQRRLRVLFGGGAEPSAEDVGYIRSLSEKLGVARSIAEMSRMAEGEALAILGALPSLAPETRAVLEGLVEYVTRRER